jgi:hypothetical protein
LEPQWGKHDGRDLMRDRHLNIFYTYNRDNQLIENNLTRALIVTLDLLTGSSKDRLIKEIFNRSLLGRVAQNEIHTYSFDPSSFSLQGHMDKEWSRCTANCYLFTIAGYSLDIVRTDSAGYGSIPDAWIFDREQELCILIEVKLVGGELGHNQLYAHAADWLHLKEEREIADRLISVTWTDIAETLHSLRSGKAGSLNILTPQDLDLLSQLQTYIGFYGVLVFEGIRFEDLLPAPTCSLPLQKLKFQMEHAFDFHELKPPPNFNIVTNTTQHGLLGGVSTKGLTEPPEFLIDYLNKDS